MDEIKPIILIPQYKKGKLKKIEEKELVLCKDCINRGNPKKCLVAYIGDVKSVPYFYVDNNGEFYCADGKRKEV